MLFAAAFKTNATQSCNIMLLRDSNVIEYCIINKIKNENTGITR